MADEIESVDDTPIEQIDAAIDATPQLPGFAAPIQSPLSEAFSLDETGQIELVQPADVSVLSDPSGIQPLVGECWTLVRDIQTTLATSLHGCLERARTFGEDPYRCIDNAVQNAVDAANALSSKCGSGIANRWSGLIGVAYSLAGSLDQWGRSQGIGNPIDSVNVDPSLLQGANCTSPIPPGSQRIWPDDAGAAIGWGQVRDPSDPASTSFANPYSCQTYDNPDPGGDPVANPEVYFPNGVPCSPISPLLQMPIYPPDGTGPGLYGLPCGRRSDVFYDVNGNIAGIGMGDPCSTGPDKYARFAAPLCGPKPPDVAPVEPTPTTQTQCTGPGCPGCQECSDVMPPTKKFDLGTTASHLVCSPDQVQSAVKVITNTVQHRSFEEIFGFEDGSIPEGAGVGFKPTSRDVFGLKVLSWPFRMAGLILAKSAGIVASLGGCTDPNAAAASATWSIVNFFDKYFGFLNPSARFGLDSIVNANCQYVIPGPPELDALRRGEWITQEQWEAAQKIQGVCIPWRDQIYELQQSRPDAFQYAQLRRRELIDKDTYDQQLKVLGYMQEKTRQDVYDLTEQIPGSSDIIRFMLRDVADEQVVQTYGYDDEFEDKFTGRLKDWAAWQGVSEEAMRYYWRAHWEIPSATQLYEMLHRLRPDRPKTGGDYDHVDVTPEVVEAALKVNDLAPTWVEPIMAISYRPLTRVDVRRMACMGVLKGDDVTEAFRDLGYSKDDAKKLAEFTRLTNAGSTCAESIGLTRSQILTLYKTDGIDRDTASEWLQSLGYESATVDSFLTGVERLRDASRRNAEVVALRRRFAMGDLTQREAVAELVSIGLAVDQAQNLAAHWDRLRRYKRKEGTVAQLCEWFQRGLMTIDTYQTRLLNLGYSAADTIRIIDTCFLKNVEKLQKEAERKKKELEQVIKDQEKRREDARKRAAAARASLPKPSRNGIGQ